MKDGYNSCGNKHIHDSRYSSWPWQVKTCRILEEKKKEKKKKQKCFQLKGTTQTEVQIPATEKYKALLSIHIVLHIPHQSATFKCSNRKT